MKALIAPELERYCAEHSAAPSALLDELEAYTRAHCANPQMLVGALEGALLRMLVKISGARRILEIGLYTGYSALTMAEALPEDGTVLSCETNAETAAIARSFFARSPHGGKIAIALGPALDTLAGLAPDPAFDLAFIDADKENYVNYYEAVLPRLAPGGLIVADNVLWSGAVLKPDKATDRALADFNDRATRDPGVQTVMLSVRDGVLLIRKR
ncbi:MAG TPA: class I SAM-dependent methyltransferase [Acidiferrobacterales bacterium]|jgi:caffeoyl-CoA O-methyltransferase